MTETKTLEQVAQYLDQRAAATDDFANRYGHLAYVDANVLRGQAMAFREAAVYALQQAANGKAAAKAEARAAKPRAPRGRPPKPSEPKPPTTTTHPWEESTA